MDAATIDLLHTVLASASLLGLTGMAIMALPWSELELAASARAWRSLGALPRSTVSRCRGRDPRSHRHRTLAGAFARPIATTRHWSFGSAFGRSDGKSSLVSRGVGVL